MKNNTLKKNIIIKKLFLAFVGMSLLSIGLNFLILINQGIGPFDSLTFVVQKILNIKKFGDASFLIHFIFSILLFIFSSKKQYFSIFISLISVFILTRFMNIFSFILTFDIGKISVSIIFILGFIILTLGIYLIAITNLIIAPYDKVVVTLAKKSKKKLGIVRMLFDILLLIVTILLSKFFDINLIISYPTLFITFATGFTILLLDKMIGRKLKSFLYEK